MYLVSQSYPLLDRGGQIPEEKATAVFPPGYMRFLQRFGAGTYRGWINVYWPDAEALKPFVEYDLWEHDEDSPITQQQIGELIAIGSSVDGDFLAVHPPTGQVLWLPRHGDQLQRLSLDVSEPEDDEAYARSLDEIFRVVYGNVQEDEVYYEPRSDTRNHLFLRLPPDQDRLTLPQLAGLCREAFPPDLVIENQYGCKLFNRRLGGYIRFNYANRQEVAIIYEKDAGQLLADIKQWLLSQGCVQFGQ